MKNHNQKKIPPLKTVLDKQPTSNIVANLSYQIKLNRGKPVYRSITNANKSLIFRRALAPSCGGRACPYYLTIRTLNNK